MVGKPEECPGAQRVAIINQLTAERYFPNQNPVVRQIAYGTQPEPDSWMTIVGIVGNVRGAGVCRPGLSVLYAPLGQFDGPHRTMSLVLPTAEQVVCASTTGTRLLSRLLNIFTALALVLALVGVYGVMSCLVAQRTHEFGVRMALGAARGAILRLVLRDGLRQGLKGAPLGISCAVGSSQPLGQYVIGMSPLHLATCAGALVLGVALAASFIAARRASRVDPLAALRHE